MTVRWSNPSGARGVQRFRVWPSGTDSYNHIDLSKNWDMIDAIIGVPKDGSEFPATLGEDGGLYQAIQDLAASSLPVGTMLAWVKSTAATPVPLGFAICDGRIILADDHDFPGIASSVTMPDLRNRFIIGADPDHAIGLSGVAATHADVNNADGAPGPQGTGGANQHVITLAQMPSHSHPGSKTGWSPLSLHWYNNNVPGDLGIVHQLDGDVDFGPYTASNSTVTGVGGWMAGQHRHKVDNLSSEGSGDPHENRPRYIGLVWIMKVKNSGG